MDNACVDLLDGQVLVLRALPATGKTVLVEAVRNELSETSYVVSGRDFTEKSQRTQIDEIRDKILSLREEHGYAQLLFDDYPHGLRRSLGPQLQRMLLHLLIDGPGARDIGALLTGRWARAMHLRVRGSPVVARALHRQLPELSADDLQLSGVEDEETALVYRELGANVALLSRLRRISGELDFAATRGFLREVGFRWVQDLPWEAILWLRKTPLARGDAAKSSTWEAVQPLLSRGEQQAPVLLPGLANSGFHEAVLDRSPSWPSARMASLSRFTELLDGVTEAMWIDRYMLADPIGLLGFLESVRERSSTRLKLLFSSSLTSDAIRRNAASVRALASIGGIELRSMAGRHYRLIHDRQLVYLGDREGGAILPTADVILSRNPPGTAVAVQVAILDRHLVEEAWASALGPSLFVP